MENETYKIPARNLETLQTKLEKLNKKAVKLNCPPITLKVVATVTEYKRKNGHEYPIVYHTVEVTGMQPKLDGGYIFVGTIEHIENQVILRSVPSQVIPETYQKATNYCDHCQTSRKRSNTYLVKSEQGEIKQVGHNCVRDFLGHADPQTLALMAECIQLLEETCGDDFGGSDYVENAAPMADFIDHVAALSLAYGYVSGAMAREDYSGTKSSTAALAWANLFPSKEAISKGLVVAVSSEAKEISKGALQWLADLDPIDNFQHNMKVLSGVSFIERKHAGIAAYVVQAYRQDLVKKYERSIQAVSSFVGTVGEKLSTQVIVKKHLPIETAYGLSHLYIMSDAQGNIVKWFASNNVMSEGKQYDITAKVKAHDEYKGIKQTAITRAKVKELTIAA